MKKKINKHFENHCIPLDPLGALVSCTFQLLCLFGWRVSSLSCHSFSRSVKPFQEHCCKCCLVTLTTTFINCFEIDFREEIARQQNIMRERKLQAEGKTDQARSDLARLAIIRKQREEAARKREEEKKGTILLSLNSESLVFV